MPTPSLSVIIPTLNEEDTLPGLLSDLAAQQGVSVEVIVADGGSKDKTRETAGIFRVKFLETSRGRGIQMNAAAKTAGAETLLFLHADSRLPDPQLLRRALTALNEEISQKECSDIAGHFPLRFLRSSKRHALAYRYLEEKTRLNRPNTTNGDQGFLMRKEFFFRIGGFEEDLPLLEDQRLAEKIRSQGKWITLPGVLESSARRFEREGFHRRYILMGIIMGLWKAGVVELFLARAPEAYREQKETKPLLLTPFFRLLRRMMREDLGMQGSLRAWLSVGRTLRQNSWQIFFWCDLLAQPLLGGRQYPFLGFYDRMVEPLMDFTLVDGITAVFSFIWFMGIIAPLFRLLESGEV